MAWKIIACCAGMAVSLVLSTALMAAGEKASGPAYAGKPGKAVGVSSICYPPGQSSAQTEPLIDTAALDKPDLILLTEGCMQNSRPGAGLSAACQTRQPRR